MNTLQRLQSILKHPGRATAWMVKIWMQKAVIHIQERFGCYPYDRWRWRQAKGDLRQSMGRWNPEAVQETMFSIFLVFSNGQRVMDDQCGIEMSLQNSAWPLWKVYYFTPTHRQPETPSASKSILEHQISGAAKADCGNVFTPKEWSELLLSAGGNWIGFWGQDDAVEPKLLKSAADCIDDTTDVVYFDEDCFTEDNSPVYHSPFFKPDWSPELLVSVNYVRHALFRRQALLDGLTHLDRDAEIGLDDLVFLGCERARKIVHLPGTLYHNRADRPVQSANGTSPTARPACTKAIAAHLERDGIQDPYVMLTNQGEVHASWRTQDKLVSIIIPTKDKVEYLERCIHSIREVNKYSNYEVVVVDSGSREEVTQRYYDQLQGDPQIRIIDYHGEFNFSRANNQGAEHARGDLLLFLNNDVEAIEPDWLSELVQWAERPKIGIVGAKLLYPDWLIQHAGIVLGMEGHASHVFSGMVERSSGPFGSVEWYRNYLAVTGACMLMRKEVFETIGGFDEAYQLVFGDVEICVRAVEQGYRVVYNPFARLIHHEGKTRGRQMISGDIQKAFARFKDQVAAGDPYYNRNLTHAVRTPALRRNWEDDPLQRLERIVRNF